VLNVIQIRSLMLLMLITVGSFSGCDFRAKEPTPAPPTTEELRNGEYNIGGPASRPITLTDGTYVEHQPPGADAFFDLVEPIAFGDLDGDGINDAAVIFLYHGSFSGRFYSLAAVLNHNGTAKHVATADLRDRVKILALSITDGTITVDLVVQGPGQGLCCPNLPVRDQYKLVGDELMLTSHTDLPRSVLPTPVPTPIVNPTTSLCGIPSNASTFPALPAPATTALHDSRYFAQTGYRIDDDTIWDYFTHRGGVATFGYPTSRMFVFEGFLVQFFQARVIQLGEQRHARVLNLLEHDRLGQIIDTSVSVNGTTFPQADSRMAPRDSTELATTLGWVKQHAPDFVATGLVQHLGGTSPVSVNATPNFYKAFLSTVSMAAVFPDGGDESLLPGFDLEVWGVPTSLPWLDLNNQSVIFLRWQKGIMMYDRSTNTMHQVLVADYLKSLLTGVGVPSDLARPADYAPLNCLYRQYDPAAPHWVRDAARLPNTDMTDAFTRK